MRNAKNQFPFTSTPHFSSLINMNDLSDPISKQITPADVELDIQKYEQADPLSEINFTVTPGLVHRYNNRVILKVTDECAVHCRFCFRKAIIAGKKGMLPEHDLEAAAGYIAEHPEITEVVLTGGDPFMLSDIQLKNMLSGLREKRPDIIFRINTRIPVVLPERISKDTAIMLSDFSPLWVSIHTNHPIEITKEAARVMRVLSEQGIPLLSQTVLLKGINDSAEILETLFLKLVQLRVKPYYLFQLDCAPGTSHFRVSIDRGLKIMKELRKRLSGYAIPVYALDLPESGGKVPLSADRIVRQEDGWIVLQDDDGNEYLYPD